jgi:hypothetical protein
MPAVFTVGDCMVAKVKLSLHDIFHICVLNCAQFRVFGLARFVCVPNLEQLVCPQKRAKVLSTKRWVLVQLRCHDVGVASSMWKGKAHDTAFLQNSVLNSVPWLWI